MVEILVLKYLEKMVDIPVLLEAPEVPSDEYPTEPKEYLIIEKTGETRTNRINTARVAVQSYGDSLYEVVKRDDVIRAIMEGCVEKDEFMLCKLVSSYNFTDTRRKKYRYQSVFEIVY